ncbi:hypothetical protein CERSUDRAFT_100250 [Gelatoporia subvermispora B]|uniref:Uncharacterized protein n=1 Tax=Ceriporiopsis subvermispora (strain B) TaxID=914234 RepID=M2QHM1_CERS8|nr:hypothetical protein CERSUDRAFT_100250 [Gelatoporia subvermispora B]
MHSLIFFVLSFLLHFRSVFATNIPPLPQIELLATGTLDIDLIKLIDVPLGGRVSAKINSGALYNPNGTLAAVVVEGTGIGNGILATDDIFIASMIFTLQWTADDTYAYVEVRGIGQQFVHDFSYIYVETNSNVWSNMNSRFLMANMTFPDIGPPIMTVLGVVGG